MFSHDFCIKFFSGNQKFFERNSSDSFGMEVFTLEIYIGRTLSLSAENRKRPMMLKATGVVSSEFKHRSLSSDIVYFGS